MIFIYIFLVLIVLGVVSMNIMPKTYESLLLWFLLRRHFLFLFINIKLDLFYLFLCMFLCSMYECVCMCLHECAHLCVMVSALHSVHVELRRCSQVSVLIPLFEIRSFSVCHREEYPGQLDPELHLVCTSHLVVGSLK